MSDSGQGIFIHGRVQDNEPGTLYPHVSFRINKLDALHCGSRPLVKLARQVFHRDIFGAGQVAAVRNIVSDDFPEYAVTAFFQQFRSESEQVVNVQQPQARKRQLEILVEFVQKAIGLYLKFRVFLYKNTIVLAHDYDVVWVLSFQKRYP